MSFHPLTSAFISDIRQTLWTSSEAEPSGGESGAATTESKEAASSAAPAEPEKAAE